MQTQIVLTSSQSKRLIAKGIAAWDPIRAAMRSGVVVIGKGTTNCYVAEELGQKVDRAHYVAGRIAPVGTDTSHIKADGADIVLEKGQRLSGVTVAEIAPKMTIGDVFLKGANAMNYDLGQAGILIGHPVGGTLGGALGMLVSHRVRLVHPAGLEKNIPGDLAAAARRLTEEGQPVGESYGLWVTHGELFTEIVAFETLFDVEALPVAAGGILGAEGAVTIALFGTRGELDRSLALAGAIQKEPPFGA
jgi:hypothetical protein